MKLNEITTLTHDDIASAIKKKESNEILPFEELMKKLQQTTNVNIEEVGDGHYAVVIADKSSPGTVQKIVKTVPKDDLLQDAYFRYLLMISQQGRIAKNPYFPRVYSINIHQSVEGNVVYTIEMERLSDIEHATSAALLAMGKKMFDDFEHAVELRKREFHPHIQESKPLKEQYLDMIVLTLDNHIEGTSNLKIIDPYLRHAIAIIKQAAKHPTRFFAPDIHQGNIMMRRASFGFQLVIIDPLS